MRATKTDHKPLESIFQKRISSPPPRLQKILLDIAPYEPTVTSRKGETMYIAGTLNRDCDNNKHTVAEEFEVLAFLAISDQEAARTRRATGRDESLRQLHELVPIDWPENQDELPETSKAVLELSRPDHRVRRTPTKEPKNHHPGRREAEHPQ